MSNEEENKNNETKKFSIQDRIALFQGPREAVAHQQKKNTEKKKTTTKILSSVQKGYQKSPENNETELRDKLHKVLEKKRREYKGPEDEEIEDEVIPAAASTSNVRPVIAPSTSNGRPVIAAKPVVVGGLKKSPVLTRDSSNIPQAPQLPENNFQTSVASIVNGKALNEKNDNIRGNVTNGKGDVISEIKNNPLFIRGRDTETNRSLTAGIGESEDSISSSSSGNSSLYSTPSEASTSNESSDIVPKPAMFSVVKHNLKKEKKALTKSIKKIAFTGPDDEEIEDEASTSAASTSVVSRGRSNIPQAPQLPENNFQTSGGLIVNRKALNKKNDNIRGNVISEIRNNQLFIRGRDTETNRSLTAGIGESEDSISSSSSGNSSLHSSSDAIYRSDSENSLASNFGGSSSGASSTSSGNSSLYSSSDEIYCSDSENSTSSVKDLAKKFEGVANKFSKSGSILKRLAQSTKTIEDNLNEVNITTHSENSLASDFGGASSTSSGNSSLHSSSDERHRSDSENSTSSVKDLAKKFGGMSNKFSKSGSIFKRLAQSTKTIEDNLNEVNITTHNSSKKGR